jgi:hypothetical protein
MIHAVDSESAQQCKRLKTTDEKIGKAGRKKRKSKGDYKKMERVGRNDLSVRPANQAEKKGSQRKPREIMTANVKLTTGRSGALQVI